jgi:hypothetical protein
MIVKIALTEYEAVLASEAPRIPNFGIKYKSRLTVTKSATTATSKFKRGCPIPAI